MRAKYFFMHSSISLIFQILSALVWPFILIWLFDVEYWGEVVDYILFVQIFTIIVDWGGRRYLARKTRLEYESFQAYLGRSLVSRLPVLLFVEAFIFTSPFQMIVVWSMSLWLLAKWLSQALESILIYKDRNYLLAATDAAAFMVSLGFVVWRGRIMSPAEFIVALAMGQAMKTVIMLPFLPEARSFFSFRHFSRDYYLAAFPYFVMVFSTLLHYILDRYFIYIYSDSVTKGNYQIFITLAYFSVVMPAYLLYPYLQLKMKQQKRSPERALWLLGLLVVPGWTLVSWLLCKYVYMLDIPFQLFPVSILFGYTAFVYYPFYHDLVSKNKPLLLAGAHLAGALSNGVLSYALVPDHGMMGALVAATISQGVLLVLVISLYFMERSSSRKEKIEFI